MGEASVKRNGKGQFVKGTASASPGRPKRVVEVDFHNILLDNVSALQWTDIFKRAITDALAGDRYARQFIADYTIGKAPSILELRAADASLLAELLKRLDEHGMSASEVFEAMLQELAAAGTREKSA